MMGTWQAFWCSERLQVFWQRKRIILWRVRFRSLSHLERVIQRVLWMIPQIILMDIIRSWGCTTVDAEDMVVQYEAQNVEYPSGILTEGGAPDIDTFCTIVIEEADAEGVRGEVVFEQAMLETGWLQFGGDASAVQFNFSGLGTTGGGVAGNSFPDVRTGIRAQVQHLKAYASSEELNQACVDNRFQYVTRESAPYVEWLGIQENPYGGGWAAGRSYGYKLRSLLAELKGEEYTWPESTETVEK